MDRGKGKMEGVTEKEEVIAREREREREKGHKDVRQRCLREC
jgi:hypothetical protein